MNHYGIQDAKGRDIKLAMQELWLGGELLPVGARLVARHVFESAEDAPLEVVYSFMLPRDAALRSFRIEGEGFSVRSDLQPVADAEAAYEDAMSQGQLTSMTRQYRDGVTNLMVGNLQPGKRVTIYLEMVAGVEAHDDGFRFRFPFTLAPGYHPEACTAEDVSRGAEMELPASKFGDVLLPPWHADPAHLHRVGFDLSIPVPGEIARVESPSHAIGVTTGLDGAGCRVALSREADLPNRDLVIEVKLRNREPLAWRGTGGDGRESFAAWVPSSSFGESDTEPVRTIFVLDRSGSMAGAAIEQARNALQACLGALSPADAFSIIAFDNRIESMSHEFVAGDRSGRQLADQFLRGIEARGGTELQQAILAAAALAGADGGDIFLITDGQVFGTEDIINRVQSIGLRVHVLGIGSASQDRFLSQLARQTGGHDRFLTPRERVDEAALALFASMSRPVTGDLEVRCSRDADAVISPPSKTVLAGMPVTVHGAAERIGELQCHWTRKGAGNRLQVTDWLTAPSGGETLRLLRGARLISDLEAQLGTVPVDALTRRSGKRIAKRLEKLSREFGLASRVMSLVAVVKEEQDQSGLLARTRVVPVGMPEDTSPESYFQARMLGAVRNMKCRGGMPAAHEETPVFGGFFGGGNTDSLHQRRGVEPADACMHLPDEDPGMEIEPWLVHLAAQIEPDGGLPGDGEESRIIRTLLALLCLVSIGHTTTSGIFSRHVTRLMSYLDGAPEVPGLQNRPREVATDFLSDVSRASKCRDVLRNYWLRRSDVSASEIQELYAAFCASS